MYTILKKSVFVILLIAGIYSCIDKDYDWDDVDKSGIFNIPPVPLGNIDSIWLSTLPIINSEFIPVIGDDYKFQVTKSHIVENIFDEDFAKKFFFDGAEKVSIEGIIEIFFPKLGNETKVTIQSVVLGNGNSLNVNIADQEFTLGENKANNKANFILTIPKEDISKMKSAQDIKFTFIFDFEGNTSDIQTTIMEEMSDNIDNFIFIKELIFKSGGVYITL